MCVIFLCDRLTAATFERKTMKKIRNNFRLVIFLALAALSIGGTFFVRAQTSNPILITLKVGETKSDVKFILPDKDANGKDQFAKGITCRKERDADPDLVTIINPKTIEEVSAISITAGSIAADSVVLLCSNSDSTVNSKIILTIKPEVEATNLTIADLSPPQDTPQSIKLLEGQTLVLKVDPKVQLKKAEENVKSLDLTGTGGTYKLTGNSRSQGDVKLIAISSGKKIRINQLDDFPVSVAGINIQSSLDVTNNGQAAIEGEGKTVSFDPVDFVPTVGLTYSSTENRLSIKSSQLTAGSFDSFPTTAIVNISSAKGGTYTPANNTKKSFTVHVVTSVRKIRITPPVDNAVYLNGGNLLLNAQVLDDSGNPTNPQPTITWSVDPADRQYINVPNSGSSIQVTALKVPSDTDKVIKITATVDKVQPLVFDDISIFVRGKRNVVDFKPIGVRIDMLDQRTASDLFGKVASKEYHISKIRIVNDLPSNLGGGAASSIIFFSDALEVRVSLEKRSIKKDRNNPGSTNEWIPISDEDIYYINNWEACDPDGQSRKDKREIEREARSCKVNADYEAEKCKSKFPDMNDPDRQNNINVCVARVYKEELDCEQEAETNVENGNCAGDIDCLNRVRFCKTPKQSLRSGQWIPFRPFIYQVVANTHDRRDERSVRSRVFLGANILGAGTSFFTSFLTLKQSSDIPLFLDKYQNLALPSFQKLFPSMREVQRQNIITEVLPPLVEVPFGSDVSKHVFFPKKAIEGILPNYYVRISSISSYNINVKVGIVQKGNITQIP